MKEGEGEHLHFTESCSCRTLLRLLRFLHQGLESLIDQVEMRDDKEVMTRMPRHYSPVTAFFLAECCSNNTSFIKVHASMTLGFDTR